MSPAEELSKQISSAPKRRISFRPVRWKCLLLPKRTQLGLTLRDVQKGTGVSIAVLSAVEHGTDPMLTTARPIAAFFGCSVEEMWPKRAEEQ